MVCTSSFVKNLTDQLLFVSCAAEALDSSGGHLFDFNVDASGLFDPGQGRGGRTTTAGMVVDGVTLAQVKAVSRYEVACDAHRWIGPRPSEAGD